MRFTYRLRVLLFSLLAIAVWLLTPPGSLADTLQFGINPPNPGNVSYAGGAKPLIGSTIAVGSITDLTSSLTLTIYGGDLNFTTGNLTSTNATNWFFGGNSSPTAIQLMGCVDGDNNGFCNPSRDPSDFSGVLFNGSISNGQVEEVGGANKLLSLDSVDILNPVLLALLGITSTAPWDGSLDLGLTTPANTPQSFASHRHLRGSITETDPPDATNPEPPTWTLLGIAGLGIGILGLGKKIRENRA